MQPLMQLANLLVRCASGLVQDIQNIWLHDNVVENRMGIQSVSGYSALIEVGQVREQPRLYVGSITKVELIEVET
jgi:hypothetical protein